MVSFETASETAVRRIRVASGPPLIGNKSLYAIRQKYEGPTGAFEVPTRSKSGVTLENALSLHVWSELIPVCRATA